VLFPLILLSFGWALGQPLSDTLPNSDGNRLVKHEIRSRGNCAFFAKRGVRWSQSFEDGSSLELTCAPDKGSILPGFHLWYISPRRARAEIGRCIFDDGCNKGWYYTPTDSEGHLSRVEWQNVDGGRNDGGRRRIDREHFTGTEEPFLDVVLWVFDRDKRTLECISDKHVYLLRPPRWPSNLKCRQLQPYIGPRVEEFRHSFIKAVDID